MKSRHCTRVLLLLLFHDGNISPYLFFVLQRKITPTKECRTGSIPLVTESVGPVTKKKFAPTIPQRRAKKSESEENKPAAIKQPRPEDKRPAPWQQPKLIQVYYMF